MVELRTRLLAGDIKGLPCEGCYAGGGYSANVQERLSEPTEAEQRVKDAVADRLVELPYAPVRYEVGGLQECNMRCKMCSLSRGKVPRVIRDDTADRFFALAEEIGWENIIEVSLASGEPLFNPTTRQIIQFFADKPETSTAIRFATNGMLIHKNMDMLDKIRNLSILIGVDACEERYEEIRRGGIWARIKANLEMLAEVKRNHPTWYVDMHSVLMKTSLPDISRLAQIAHDLGFDYRAHAIEGNFFDENIFAFPHLLDGMDWEKELDASIEATRDTFPATAEELKKIRHNLREIRSGKKARMRAGTAPENLKRFVNFFENHTDECVVFGLTRNLFDYFNTIDCPESIKAVTDIGATQGKCFTYDFIPPEAMASVSDNVVVSSSFDHAAYMAVLEKVHPNANVTLISFWREKTEQRIQEVAEEFSDKAISIFATGGSTEVLLSQSRLKDLDYVCFSDNDKSKWGTSFFSRPVVPPTEILEYSQDVLILSENYFHDIKAQLQQLYGDKVRIHGIF